MNETQKLTKQQEPVILHSYQQHGYTTLNQRPEVHVCVVSPPEKMSKPNDCSPGTTQRNSLVDENPSVQLLFFTPQNLVLPAKELYMRERALETGRVCNIREKLETETKSDIEATLRALKLINASRFPENANNKTAAETTHNKTERDIRVHDEEVCYPPQRFEDNHAFPQPREKKKVNKPLTHANIAWDRAKYRDETPVGSPKAGNIAWDRAKYRDETPVESPKAGNIAWDRAKYRDETPVESPKAGNVAWDRAKYRDETPVESPKAGNIAWDRAKYRDETPVESPKAGNVAWDRAKYRDETPVESPKAGNIAWDRAKYRDETPVESPKAGNIAWGRAKYRDETPVGSPKAGNIAWDRAKYRDETPVESPKAGNIAWDRAKYRDETPVESPKAGNIAWDRAKYRDETPVGSPKAGNIAWDRAKYRDETPVESPKAGNIAWDRAKYRDETPVESPKAGNIAWDRAKYRDETPVESPKAGNIAWDRAKYRDETPVESPKAGNIAWDRAKYRDETPVESPKAGNIAWDRAKYRDETPVESPKAGNVAWDRAKYRDETPVESPKAGNIAWDRAKYRDETPVESPKAGNIAWDRAKYRDETPVGSPKAGNIAWDRAKYRDETPVGSPKAGNIAWDRAKYRDETPVESPKAGNIAWDRAKYRDETPVESPKAGNIAWDRAEYLKHCVNQEPQCLRDSMQKQRNGVDSVASNPVVDGRTSQHPPVDMRPVAGNMLRPYDTAATPKVESSCSSLMSKNGRDYNIRKENRSEATSTLKAGKYIINVDRIEGVDVSTSCEGFTVSFEDYKIVPGNGSCHPEVVGHKIYRSLIIKREGVKSFLIALARTVELLLMQDGEEHLLILQLLYRGRPFAWTSVNILCDGSWVGMLRKPPVDMAAAMDGAPADPSGPSMRGNVAPEYSDVIQEAETYLASADTNGLAKEGPAGAEVAGGPIIQTRPEITSIASVAAGTGDKPLGTSPQHLTGTSKPAVKKQKLNVTPLTLECDADGCIIVPDGYKSGTPSPEHCAGEGRQSPLPAGVLFGLRTLNDRLSPRVISRQEGVDCVVNLKLRSVIGLPLNAICTRVLLYVVGYISGRTLEIQNDISDPSLFMRPPNVISHQKEGGGSIVQTFDIELEQIIVAEKTHVIVIIEYATDSKSVPIAFGHASLPIHIKATEGNFLTRIRLGDPRQPEVRALDAEGSLNPAFFSGWSNNASNYTQMEVEERLNAAALYKRLLLPVSTSAVCHACSFVSWSINGGLTDPYFEYPGEPPLSEEEAKLHAAREAVAEAKIPHRAASAGLLKVFGWYPACVFSNFTDIVPYDPKRGFFICTEAVHGVGAEKALYFVVTTIDTDKCSYVACTKHLRWSSDIGVPHFNDPAKLINDVEADPNVVAQKYLLKVTNLETIKKYGDKHLLVEVVGWSLLKLFPENGVLRGGRYAVALFEGTPPPQLLDEVKSHSLEKVFNYWFARGEIQYCSPPASVVVSAGDPHLVMQLSVDHPGRPQPQKLMATPLHEDVMPCVGTEGSVGYQQSQILNDMGVTVEQAEEAVGAAVSSFLQRTIKRKCQSYADMNIRVVE